MSGRPAPGGGPFRRIYPPQEAVVFDGGLDNKFDRALLPDNESPDCLNVHFFNGSVETRDGAVLLNTTPIGVSNGSGGFAPFDGLYGVRRNNLTETMCAFAGGSMYTLNSTTFVTVPSAQSVFTAGARVATEMAENYLFIGNGGVGGYAGGYGYKWDGTLFTQHGVPAPTVTATVTSGATGSLATNGAYVWVYSYVNSASVEGNYSPVTTTFAMSNAGLEVTVAGIPIAPASAGVNAVRLYRNTVSFPTQYRLVTVVTGNVTTSIVDNKADGSLGALAPQSNNLDNSMPPAYTAIIYCRGMLFMNDVNNPNFVWYTSPGNPYTVPFFNFFRVGDKTSDLVKGFAVYNNQLIIFCERSTWVNFMPDPATPSGWEQVQTNSPYGCKSPFAPFNYAKGSTNDVLFPAFQEEKFVGFASLAGQSIDPSSSSLTVTTAGSLLTSDRIETDMFSVQESFAGNISAIVYKTRAYITLTWGSGSAINNRCYLFDFSLSNLKKGNPVSWSPITGWNAAQFCMYGGKLYYGSSDTSGHVFQVDGTGVYSDNGAAINSYYWTKEFPGYPQDINFFKDYRYANFLVDLSGSYFMNIGYRTDSDTGQGALQQVSLNPGGTLWGQFLWGMGTWGGGSAQNEFRVSLGPERGKRVQFFFSNQNTAGQKFKVQRMNFAYNLKGFR